MIQFEFKFYLIKILYDFKLENILKIKKKVSFNIKTKNSFVKFNFKY